jgi:UDP-N-acetyl-D-mannosaminuronic acid dehydrogenase
MEPVELLEKVRRRDFSVGVVGLGRVGLPLAIAYAVRGIRTYGVDLDEARLAAIRNADMPFQEIDGQEALLALKDGDVLQVAADYEILRNADAIFITVGTLLNNEMRPDYQFLEKALTKLAGILHPVQLLMLRSTVAPGTLTKRVKPFMARHLQLNPGKDILLASAPERIAAGFALQELPGLPEVVGGIDEMSTETAAEVLKALNPAKKVFKTSPEGAELSKLFTNVYRYVTFALANEFALLGEVHGVDAHQIIQFANQDYPRGGIPRPGPCGGPCLAKDGYFLVEDLTFPDFILTAWKLNEGVPAHVVRRLKERLHRRGDMLAGSRVCVLGLGFKAESDDTRQSPAVRIIDLLRAEGADVVVSDPFHESADLKSAVEGAVAIVLATNHRAFRDVPSMPEVINANPAPILVDCWREWDGEQAREAGLELIVFGKGEEE